MVVRTLKNILVGFAQGVGYTFERRNDFTARAVFPASATIKR